MAGTKCKIYSGTNLNLREIGGLLGFPENQVINSMTWETSPNKVDVNKGLRYIFINCDLVDSNQNFNSNGERSCTLVTLPIPTNQLLNSTNSFYNDINSQVIIKNGDINRLNFYVDSNIGGKVDVNVLLELYIK